MCILVWMGNQTWDSQCQQFPHVSVAYMHDLGWAKRGGVANGPDFEYDQINESPTIWNPDRWVPF